MERKGGRGRLGFSAYESRAWVAWFNTEAGSCKQQSSKLRAPQDGLRNHASALRASLAPV